MSPDIYMPEKSTSERLDDSGSTENNLQTELVGLSSRLKAVEDENSQLRQDIKDLLAAQRALRSARIAGRSTDINTPRGTSAT
jgi:septal ring factor EnvC (AmiA/AmiB activator)